MLERLQKVGSFLKLFEKRVLAVIPPSVSFAFVECVRDVVVSEVKLKRIVNLYVTHMQISKQIVYPILELNHQSLEIVENIYYLGDTIGATGGAVNSTDDDCSLFLWNG